MTRIALLDDRAVLAVGGPDAIGLLQGLLTNTIGAKPAYAGLLTPQGKALAEMIVHPDGQGGLLLDLAGDRIDDIARRLTLYRLRSRADIRKRADMQVYAAWDGDAGEPADPRLAALGQRWIAPHQGAPEPAGVYRRHRMMLGVPEGSDEIGVDSTLWLETNARELAGVDFSKGCYVGQENTARMNYRGKVRRRLLALDVAGAPESATQVMAGEKEAGLIRSRLDDIAMAWLRLEFIEQRAPLTLGGSPVAVRWPAFLCDLDVTNPD